MPAARRTVTARGRRTCRTALAVLLGGLVSCGTPAHQPTHEGTATASKPDAQAAPAAAQRPLHRGTGLYPRAIRLRHNKAANGRILASTVTFHGKDGHGAIQQSRDGGSTFQHLSTVRDPQAAKGRGLCCTTLYELPRRVGKLPAGTVLWADSTGQDAPHRRMGIRVFASTNAGRSWSYLSTVATSRNKGGLWEPEFSVDAQGNLVCHYSDESDPARSQKLVAARTSDGKHWRGHHDTIASNVPSDRPGMAVVRRLPSGRYVMTYEICAPDGKFACVAHVRTSRDGWHWGDPADLGVRPQTADGAYFTHAPTLAWAPQRGNPQGKLLLIGQVLNNRDGKRAPGSGKSILVNSRGGHGPWRLAKAPVTVRSTKVDSCPNYSSTLLPSTDGKRLLEIATDYRNGTCVPAHATGRT